MSDFRDLNDIKYRLGFIEKAIKTLSEMIERIENKLENLTKNKK